MDALALEIGYAVIGTAIFVPLAWAAMWLDDKHPGIFAALRWLLMLGLPAAYFYFRD